ncbi:MAG TPA: hypothetical protein VMA97_04835 [Streptosporangiaceae bacterium]|nr:hypothetical protein [Streptosporangiaceae bacterium]
MATYTTPRTPGSAGPGGRPPGTPRSRGDSPSPRPPLTPSLRAPRTRGDSPSRRGAPPDPGRIRAPRHTRPITGPGTRPAQPTTRPAARPPLARTRAQGPRRPRAPFILLLVGLLGGALVSLLVISTTLAEGSYRITNLQQQNAGLAKQEQLLTQQVAQASSPSQIAQEAEAFGMRPNPALQFINLKTGKVVKGQVSKSDAEINVPGYTP